ncbi:MAG: DciA family protein [Actinomycetes bacterium]
MTADGADPDRPADRPSNDTGDAALPDLSVSLLAQVRAASKAAPRRQRARPRRRRVTEAGSYSGAGPDERDPQSIGRAVDDLVGERGWTAPLAVGGVEGRWPEIVGADVSQHCEPEQFEAGKLTVRADSTAWATQVRMLAPTLLARLNDDLGAGTVTHLQVLGPQGPSWKKGKLRVKGRGPRDTYG